MSGIFDPNVHIKTVTVVGLGGTGAQVARLIGRIAYDMQRSRRHVPEIVLIDPDRVEAKNVGRQLFAPSDVGQYKAEVVGKRLNLALGLNVRWIPEAVEAAQHFDRYASNLVLSCVDNHMARRELHQVNGVIIGAGNHADAGQVCVGNCNDPALLRRALNGREGKYAYLPKEGVLFPALLEPEAAAAPPPQPPMSCADLVAAGDQQLLVNDWLACVVGQYAYKLLNREPITTFLTYINTTDLTVTSKLICQEELAVYLNA